MGGVLCPLLANIALHGLETALGVVRNTKGHVKGSRAVVRYADDFAVFCETKDDAERVGGILTGWLAERGLVLAEDKTRIVHLTKGFDFLGFVRHEVAHMAVTTEQLGRNLVFYHQYPTGTCGRSNAAV